MRRAVGLAWEAIRLRRRSVRLFCAGLSPVAAPERKNWTVVLGSVRPAGPMSFLGPHLLDRPNRKC